MTECLSEMGLTVFPALGQVPDDGYIRVIRSGSLLGNILVNLQTPGPGSDADIAALITRIKRRDPDGDENT